MINVTQEGVDFSISQYTFEFDSAGTPIEATVISKYAWDIDIPEKASWLEVSPAQSSGGETVVTFTPKPFDDRTPRTKQLLTLNYNGTFTMLTVSQSMPNEAPSAPVLISPAANATDVKVNAQFQWQAATDPDGDELSYKLMVSDNGGTSWVSTTTAATSAKLTNLMSKNTSYVWKVEASDGFGGKAESAVNSFATGEGGAYARRGSIPLADRNGGGTHARTPRLHGRRIHRGRLCCGRRFRQGCRNGCRSILQCRTFPYIP